MKYLLHIITLLTSLVAVGQAPVIEAAVSSNSVTVGEVFTYQITSNQDCEISTPEFGDLEVVAGPSQGVSEGSSTVNGVTTSYRYYTFTYKLRAPKKGNYQIAPVSMKCKLKKVNSGNTISIQVGESNNTTSQSGKSNYYFKITCDESSVYVGEPFTLSFKFYSTKKPSQIEAITQGTASGLWRKDLNPNRTSFNMTQENIKGVRFYVLELSEEVCIAQRPGKITIEPYYASLIHSIDIFNNEREEGKSNSLNIDVKPLPEQMPENFNGLVGDFNLSYTVDKKSLIQGQAMELILTIEGVGNLNSFDEPKLVFPEGFSISDPELTEEVRSTNKGIEGKLTYTYILTANEPGEFLVQPFSFSYFHLNSKKYKEVTTENFTVLVEKGNESHGAVYKGQKPVEVEASDIQFIHQDKGKTFGLDEFIFGSLPYMILLIVPPILLFLVLLLRRKKKNISEEDRVALNKKSARKSAQKNLNQANQLLKSGDEKEALKQLQSSLVSYLMLKLDLSLSSLSIKTITQELEQKKTDTHLILNVSNIWKKIEMSQYAPISAQNLADTILETQKLIDELDEKI